MSAEIKRNPEGGYYAFPDAPLDPSMYQLTGPIVCDRNGLAFLFHLDGRSFTDAEYGGCCTPIREDLPPDSVTFPIDTTKLEHHKFVDNSPHVCPVSR